MMVGCNSGCLREWSWWTRRIFLLIREFTIVFTLLLILAGALRVDASTGISGRITDVEGHPIVGIGVGVSLQSENGAGLMFYIVPPTNTNGEYSVNLTTSGTYRVATHYWGQNYIDQGTNVIVQVDQVVSNVNFLLSIGGIIRGTVTGEGAGPLSNIIVKVFSLVDVHDSRQCVTDAGGMFSLVGLSTKRYYVSVDVPSGVNYFDIWYGGLPVVDSSVPPDGSGVDVVAGETTNNVNFSLSAGGAIRGVVTGEGHGALSNISLKVYNVANSLIAEGVTDAAGNYSVSGLATGDYFIRTAVADGTDYVDVWYTGIPVAGYSLPSVAARVAVTAGLETDNIDFALTVGGAVSGHVKNEEGVSLGSVSLSICSLAGDYIKGATTDTNGSYAVRGVIPGIQRLSAASFSGVYLAQDVTVDVAAGAPLTDVDFVLIEGGAISVRVTDHNDMPVCGVPISVNRETTPLGSVVFAIWSPPATDPNGVYLKTGLEAGKYTVRAAASSKGYIDATQSNITVTAGLTSSNIVFKLDTGADISGRVTDCNGLPIPGVQVYVSSTNGGRLIFRPIASVNTNGEYLLRGLPPGGYFVRTWTYGDVFGGTNNAIDEWYDNIPVQQTEMYTNRVTVVLGGGQAVSNVNFSLDAGGVIDGTVKDDHGLPCGSVTVSACDSNATVVLSNSTGINGQYRLTGLCSGAYYIRTSSGGLGAFDQWYTNRPVAGGGVPVDAVPVHVVEGSVTNGVDFVLTSGGSISGHVRRESGVAVPYITVGQESSIWPWRPMWPSGFSDLSGLYRISGLTSGVYRITLDVGSAGYIAQSSNVAVTVGEAVENVDFVLARKAPQISGCSRLDSRLSFAWTAVPAVAYQVECTTNLMSGWTNAPCGVLESQRSLRSVGVAQDLEYEVPELPDLSMFFRLKLKE